MNADTKGQVSELPNASRLSFSLTTVLLVVVFGTTLVASLIASVFAVETVYQNKLRDSWTILFLEMEERASELGRIFQSRRNSEPDVILHDIGNGQFGVVQGNFDGPVSADQLGLGPDAPPTDLMFFSRAGEVFISEQKPTENTDHSSKEILVWRDNPAIWLKTPPQLREVKLYFANRLGQLLFSTDNTINNETFVRRQLVQKFIGSPLEQGQMEITGDWGSGYGVFYRVPGTNLMMFLEASKNIALFEVRSVAKHFAIALFWVLAASLVLLWFPLRLLLNPLREIISSIKEVGKGNFALDIREGGVGEVRVLTQILPRMAENLLARDRKIHDLQLEHEQKLVMQTELAVAQGIQENFLPRSPLPSESGLEAASKYVPARECGGDWYGYFFDAERRESVFVVADVSGHGAGAAMFTSIIAAAFDETRAESGSQFQLVSFAARLNRLILKLGLGRFHVTMAGARYQVGSHRLEILVAGHPPPILIQTRDGVPEVQMLMIRNDFLGASAHFSIKSVPFPFEEGSTLLLYTDGLIEGRLKHANNPESTISKICAASAGASPATLIERLHTDWRAAFGPQGHKDDLCLLAFKAK